MYNAHNCIGLEEGKIYEFISSESEMCIIRTDNNVGSFYKWRFIDIRKEKIKKLLC